MAAQMSVDDIKYLHTTITAGTIRVIQLEPSPVLEAPLRCSLLNKTLEDCKNDILDHYIALSYVWGDESDQRTIVIDGRGLDITASLDCALRHMRHDSKIVEIWADGVCINQRDINDRNVQVRQMGEIYSTASHTIIFLGPSSPECDSLMSYIASHTSFGCKDRGLSNWGQISPRGFQELLSVHILSLPWFSRVWVLQELVLSVDPWVQVGRTRVRWTHFYRVVSSGTKYDDSDNIHTDSNTNSGDDDSNDGDSNDDTGDSDSGAGSVDILSLLCGMYEIKSIYEYTRHKNQMSPLKHKSLFKDESGLRTCFLLDILRRRRGCGVTDIRDMIYGHLGMITDGLQLIILIEYGDSSCHVFEHAARQIITQLNDLTVLAFVEDVQPEERRVGVPSWAPDWTVPYTHELARSDLCEKVNKKSVNFDVDMFEIPHVLIVPGTVHGSIVQLVCPPAGYEDDGLPEYTFIFDNQILKWLARLDIQKTLGLILACFRRVCEQFYASYFEEGQLYTNLPNRIPVNIHNELREKLIALISETPGTSETIQLDDGSSPMRTMIFVLHYMLQYVKYAFAYGKPAGILDSGAVIKLPHLARLGDLVVSFGPYTWKSH